MPPTHAHHHHNNNRMAATPLPVLVIRADGTRGRQRQQRRPAASATATAEEDTGPVHRVYVVRDSSTPASTSATACCVVRFASSTGESHEVHYHHDEDDALAIEAADHDDDAAAAEAPAAATTGADGSPQSWHAALTLLARAKARGSDVHVTLQSPNACEGGDGFVVGVLAAHALAHGACRKGLKHAVPSVQRALREARLHEARAARSQQSVSLAELPNPARPQPRVMAFAGWATVLSAWQERHVHRVWSGVGGWGDWGAADEEDEDEDEEDRSRRFVVYVGDRFAAESREFLAHAGITRVVNCGAAHGCVNAFAQEPHMLYATFDSDDMDPRAPYPGGQWDRIMQFLREAKAQGRPTLVHCVAGVNRSVTTLAIFLVLEGAASSVVEAVELIKERRSVAAPLARYIRFAETYVERVRQTGYGGDRGDGTEAMLEAGNGEGDESMEGRRYRKRRDKPKRG